MVCSNRPRWLRAWAATVTFPFYMCFRYVKLISYRFRWLRACDETPKWWTPSRRAALPTSRRAWDPRTKRSLRNSVNQSIKNPHRATYGQGEADRSAASRVANAASQAAQAWGAVSPNSSSESRDLGYYPNSSCVTGWPLGLTRGTRWSPLGTVISLRVEYEFTYSRDAAARIRITNSAWWTLY